MISAIAFSCGKNTKKPENIIRGIANPTTPLTKPAKREIKINGAIFKLTKKSNLEILNYLSYY